MNKEWRKGQIINATQMFVYIYYIDNLFKIILCNTSQNKISNILLVHRLTISKSRSFTIIQKRNRWHTKFHLRGRKTAYKQ